jgi:hypothetical protein
MVTWSGLTRLTSIELGYSVSSWPPKIWEIESLARYLQLSVIGSGWCRPWAGASSCQCEQVSRHPGFAAFGGELDDRPRVSHRRGL